MKKVVSILLAVLLTAAVFAGCSDTSGASNAVQTDSSALDNSTLPETSVPTENAKPVDLVVVTSYGGDDAGRVPYEAAFREWEDNTGNTVMDSSANANEEWKSRVLTDFQTGAEPDVLFYFTGPDIQPIADKIVPIDEIRTTYPDYAGNMNDASIPVSPDNKMYGVPVYGNWEAMFANKKVLAEAGVDVPGADYTWSQFLADCEKIKEAGFTPIACSLYEVPHYWFEFSIFNYGSVATHSTIPSGMDDPLAQNWVNGLNDIKDLYERGYFPANTMTATDPEIWQLGYDNKAAFAADGSWKVAGILSDALDPDEWVTVYVPSNGGTRKTTDMVAGISMGYMITRKAWDDPEKQAAAVDFINHMTSREVISTFNQFRMTALKDGVIPMGDLEPLQESGMEMANGSTGAAFFLGDMLTPDARAYMMENIKNVCTGSMTAEDVVTKTLEIHHTAS